MAPVSFPRWREVLHREQFSAELLRSHEGKIFAYLKNLKELEEAIIDELVKRENSRFCHFERSEKSPELL